MTLPDPYYHDEASGITIYCGDSREIVPKIGEVGLVLTDPPYGIDHDTNYSRFGKETNRDWNAPIAGDSEPFDPTCWLSYKCVLFGANYFSERLPQGRWVVWDKRDGHTPMLLADAEMAWHNCPGRSVQVFSWTWNGFRRQGEMGTAYHPTQKPVALMRWCIEAFAPPEGIILDPYMGSGTTLRAAKDLGRKAIGIEIEEKYAEIAVKRLQQQTLSMGFDEVQERKRPAQVLMFDGVTRDADGDEVRGEMGILDSLKVANG